MMLIVNLVVGCRYLFSVRVSPHFGKYQIILLGDRGMCSCARVCEEPVLKSETAGSWTRDLFIESPVL